MKTQNIGYHFTGDNLRDGRPIPAIGEWLEHSGLVVPCSSGLHCSEHPMDALTYAPGNLLHRVILEGDLQEHGENGRTDKWCGRRRQITASINAEHVMRDFARWCALQVIHLWAATPIVRQYLETGDESIRDAAWDAAVAAAWAAARAAAWAAAWAAQRNKFKELVDMAFDAGKGQS